jgi:hypothetical protein
VCIFHISHPCYILRPSHHLDLITLIIFGEGYNLRSSLLCSLLNPPSWVQIFSPAPCSQTSTICVLPLAWKTHTKQ